MVRFCNLTSKLIDIFAQKGKKKNTKRNPIYQKERTAFTFSAIEKKDYKLMYRKNKSCFCSCSHFHLLHVISNFVMIEPMKRVWQPGARIQSFIVPFECGHIGMNGFWTFGSTFQIFLHMLIVSPVKLMNVWGTSVKSELIYKVGVRKTASYIVISTVPVYRYFYLLYSSRNSMPNGRNKAR